MTREELDSHMTLIETPNASIVPFSPGQLIIEDSGKTYYDPSFGTDVSSRISLNSANVRPARVVIGSGTSPNEYTKDDVDFICDSTTSFDTVLVEALNCLPSTGGEIILLDGDYTLSENSAPEVLRHNIVIRGNGDSTKIIFEPASDAYDAISVSIAQELAICSCMLEIKPEAMVDISSNKTMLDNVTIFMDNQIPVDDDGTTAPCTLTIFGACSIKDCNFYDTYNSPINQSKVMLYPYSNALQCYGNTFTNVSVSLPDGEDDAYCFCYNNTFDYRSCVYFGQATSSSSVSVCGKFSDNVFIGTGFVLLEENTKMFVHGNMFYNEPYSGSELNPELESIVNKSTNNVIQMNYIQGSTDYVSYQST